ncbi:cadmium-translocating P-type ATPase [Staphylococcus gallinarum]|uniref:heavy metal translocating P-type ATPase n=1 Tax=Staphylococcus gallinarum TaxID=1293 RepID=UPI002DBC1331|nr:heavy metal translocating P-type ATPase [Staphylococcus gallinarum]MEB6243517.1 cadmium-translocating P-type ATPase [Staphylococcus gallinarum]MEB6296557.1 cadmium-translocating P-type ATPase [Staphylococcus gallinarum]
MSRQQCKGNNLQGHHDKAVEAHDNHCCTTNLHEVNDHSNNSEADSQTVKHSAETNYILKITGMDCNNCAKTIEQSVLKLNVVQDARISFATGKLHLNVNSKEDIQQVIQTIEQLGYGVSVLSNAGTETVFKIQGMDCNDCAKTIEQHMSQLDYVDRANVNFATGKLALQYNGQPKQVIKEVFKLGYSATLSNEQTQQQSILTLFKLPLISLILLLCAWLFTYFNMSGILVNTLLLTAIIICAFKTVKSGIFALKAKRLDMNVLMSVAIIGAVLLGEYFEATMVILLFVIGTSLQQASIEKTRASIQSLMDLTPQVARVKQEDDWSEQSVASIAVGNIIQIRPGDRVPLDGVIIEGTSAINQAPITGESIPVNKSMGDEIYAGTINEDNTLVIEVTKTEQQTMLAHIIDLVETAQEQQAPTQSFIDRFAEIYTPVVFVLALLVMIVPPLFAVGTWGSWIYKGLELLVIACPCALVISTPVAIVTAIGNAAKNGILIKGGSYLEQLSSLNVLAFDKTGTLTTGEPTVQSVVEIDSDKQQLIAIAQVLESQSSHPIGQAILNYTDAQNNLTSMQPETFENIPGKGISAVIKGERYFAGNMSFVASINDKVTQYQHAILNHMTQGETVVVIASQSQLLGYITLSDKVREGTQATMLKLKRCGIEETIMLTGDNKGSAKNIARSSGIKSYYAELLPEDKLRQIAMIQQQGKVVGMIGDGINDAPALATSNIGIAMGGIGTDTAMETADVVLMTDKLEYVHYAIQLSKRTTAIIKQNIYFSIIIKLIAFMLVFPGWLTLWLAILSDTGAAVLVVLNALRLLKGIKI